MEKWSEDDPIPYDDIDILPLLEATQSLFPQFVLEEEEDGGIPINPANFSAKYYKNKGKSKDRIWCDTTAFEKFLDLDQHASRQDKTILRPLHSTDTDLVVEQANDFSVAQFLRNGYASSDMEGLLVLAHDVNDSIMGPNTSDVSINLNTDFIPPHFPLPKRTGSNSAVNQTPKVRARQPSNDRTYQTPIARMRRNFTD